MLFIHFLHTYHPHASFVLFHLRFHWYGILISFSLLLGLFLLKKELSFYPFLDKDKILDLLLGVILGGLIGARLFDLLLEWPYYQGSFWNIFKIWQGGLAIQGAVLGGGLVGYFLCRREKINFWLLADLGSLPLALGQAIGRWGNYFNQELFGWPTKLPWGIPIDPLHRGLMWYDYQYFQPTFLYESLLDLLNFFILAFLFFWRVKLDRQKKKPQTWGQKIIFVLSHNLFLVYLLNYAAIRFSLEFIRIDPTFLLFGFRFPQLISALLFLFIVIVLIYKIKNFKEPESLKSEN